MQLDAAIMAIQKRSVGGCIDMGVVFLREHFIPVITMTACLAVPFCSATWWLVSRHEWSVVGILLLFSFVSPFLGAALVGEAGKRVFGDQFSIRRGYLTVLRQFFPLGVLLLASRLFSIMGLLFCMLPGYLVALRYGFLSEIFLLERQKLAKYEGRLNDLEMSVFGLLIGRIVMTALFYGMSVLSLLVLVDLTSGYVFGLPVLIGRVTSLEYFIEEITHLLTQDELVLTVLTAVMWLVYPVARLAWFFCYLDVRIRQEGWDVELDFRVEARRVEALA
mgnify:CR=1 FL=1